MKKPRISFECLSYKWEHDGKTHHERRVAMGFHANKEGINIYLLFWGVYISFHRSGER